MNEDVFCQEVYCSGQEDTTRLSYSLLLWIRSNVGKKTDVCILFPEVCGHMLYASKLYVGYIIQISL